MLFLSSIEGSLKTLEIKGLTYGRINKIVYCLDTLQIKGLIVCKANGAGNKFISVVKCKDEILEKCKKLDIKVKTSEFIKMVDKLKEHLRISKINHDKEIMKQLTLKSAHIYCVINGVSAQQYGPLLEKYIINRYNYKKKKSTECIGDCSDDKFTGSAITKPTKFYRSIRLSEPVFL
jgi:hypothetical protein